MLTRPCERHYTIRDLDFEDFWDICGHFARAHPHLPDVFYSVSGKEGIIIENEMDIADILHRIRASGQVMTSCRAELTDEEGGGKDRAVLLYRARGDNGEPAALQFTSPGITKLRLHDFEEALLEHYCLPGEESDTVVFGQPCEILATVLDMPGFSSFCERPNIESPYICGLMHSFYKTAQQGFSKYPPEVVKFTGDGLVVVWETSHEDRELAIQSCLDGALELDSRWQIVRRKPQFSHGAPDSIGIGISFGLGSRLPTGEDYIGRPINVASRLCGACPGGEIIADTSVPGIPDHVSKEDSTVHIKAFGRYKVWRIKAD